MESLTVAATIVFFSIWLALTVVNQFHEKRPSWLVSMDIFGLVPIWTFFAPNPGMTDYYLLYRDRLPGGTLGSWKHIRLQHRTSLLSAIWGPDRRRNKALSDLVAAAVQLVMTAGQKGIHVSIPYLLLLNYITSLPHSMAAEATQFMILENDGFIESANPSRVLMLSGMHSLG